MQWDEGRTQEHDTPDALRFFGQASSSNANVIVYKLALNYVDSVYGMTKLFPTAENHNLKSQMERAATSIVLNIVEGSTGQSDKEQHRFLGLALRSYLETIACMDIADRRQYINSKDSDALRAVGHELFVKLQAFRKALR